MLFQFTRVVKDANYIRIELIDKLQEEICGLIEDLECLDADDADDVKERDTIETKINAKGELMEQLVQSIKH